jgi:hypothetical protein
MRAVGGVVEGAGFAEQERQVRQWAERHGHEVVRTVTDRCSGSTPGPGLYGAAQAVWAGEADAVVVTSRRSLGRRQTLGATVLAVDEDRTDPAPAAPAPGASARPNVRVVVTWVAIAIAVLVAQGVATAASSKAPTPFVGICDPHRYELMACDTPGAVR